MITSSHDGIETPTACGLSGGSDTPNGSSALAVPADAGDSLRCALPDPLDVSLTMYAFDPFEATCATTWVSLSPRTASPPPLLLRLPEPYYRHHHQHHYRSAYHDLPTDTNPTTTTTTTTTTTAAATTATTTTTTDNARSHAYLGNGKSFTQPANEVTGVFNPCRDPHEVERQAAVALACRNGRV